MPPTEELHALIKRYSIQVVPAGKEILLSSGEKSRIYCDLKKTILRADAQRFLGFKLSQVASEFKPTAYAGVALGGCHLASLAAARDEGWKDVIYVRKEAKEHGTKNLIEAPEMSKESARIVLLEDVTTTANSARKAVEVLRAAGYHVQGIITVVDRREAWNMSDVPDVIDGVPIRAIYRIESFFHGISPDEA